MHWAAHRGGLLLRRVLGRNTLAEPDFAAINAKAEAIAKEKQAFERLVLTKDEALRMFADNVFKSQLIAAKIPDGGYTTAYRCGPLIDLCRGPHVPTTASIKAFEVMRASAAYWLGNAANDSLQRVYGVSFPDAKQLKAHKHMLEEAKKRDHRVIGSKQELFFFHELSPGSCFFLPHGARIYNKLMDFIRAEYRKRGYTEVISPNMFNIDLWRISGHAEHYLENMFTFGVEGADFGLKPMNCPGHCLMFDVTNRSYKGARTPRARARACVLTPPATASPTPRHHDSRSAARPRVRARLRSHPPFTQSCPSAWPTLACCTATSFRARCRA